MGDLPELTSQAGSGHGLWQLVQTPACPPHPFLTSREQISRARALCQASAGTCSGWGHTLMLAALTLLHPAGEADTGSGKDNGEVRTGRGCHRPLTEASKDVESGGLGKCGQDAWSARRGWLQVLEVCVCAVLGELRLGWGRGRGSRLQDGQLRGCPVLKGVPSSPYLPPKPLLGVVVSLLSPRHK